MRCRLRGAVSERLPEWVCGEGGSGRYSVIRLRSLPQPDRLWCHRAARFADTASGAKRGIDPDSRAGNQLDGLDCAALKAGKTAATACQAVLVERGSDHLCPRFQRRWNFHCGCLGLNAARPDRSAHFQQGLTKGSRALFEEFLATDHIVSCEWSSIGACELSPSPPCPSP